VLGDNDIVTENGKWTINVTNTHEPEKVDLNGLKIWNDEDDQDGIRPLSIRIDLMRKDKGSDQDPVFVTSKTVTEKDGWAWSFEDLPRFKPGESGTEYEYSFSEAEIVYPDDFAAGYSVAYSQPVFHAPVLNEETGEMIDAYWSIEVTNIHEPETVNVEGLKIWDDADDQDAFRPESITIPVWSQKPIREEGVPEIMTPPNSAKCSFSVMHQAEALNQQTRELLGSFDFEKNDCLVCHLYTNCAAVTATGAEMQNNTLSVQMNCVDAAKYQPICEMQILLGIPKSLAVSLAQCRTELTHTSGNPNEAESIQPQPESITLRFSE
jgi:hypothetical protein